MIVDSHCHLDFPELNGDLEAVIKRAHENDVMVMQTICTKLENFPVVHSIAKNNKNIFCSFGIHPCNVNKETLINVNEIISYADQEKVIGIGETGLDYYHSTANKEEQITSFCNHFEAACFLDLPVIIHTRDASEDTYQIIKNYANQQNFRALIHCFTADKEFAKKVLDLGLYISISGIVTFKNAKDLQEIVKYIPLDRLLVETDAPYLAPNPHRGKVNEPSYTYYVAKFIAELKEIDFDVVANTTSDNFFKLFSKANYEI